MCALKIITYAKRVPNVWKKFTPTLMKHHDDNHGKICEKYYPHQTQRRQFSSDSKNEDMENFLQSLKYYTKKDFDEKGSIDFLELTDE